MLALYVLLIWLSLAVLFFTATYFLQGFWYTEPAQGLSWRAPAAAGVLAVFFGLWGWLASTAPGRYDTVFRFSPREEKDFPKFVSVRQGKSTTFELRKTAQGRAEFRDTKTNQRWSRSDEIIVTEDGKEARFLAEKDEKGQFKVERSKVPYGLGWLVGPGTEGTLRYLDAQGRVMTEDAPGRVSVSRWSLFLVNMFLNFMQPVLWFVCLWLLLEYQWPHALGLAFCLWIGVTLTVLPMFIDQANAIGEKRPTATPATPAPAGAK